MIGLIDKNARGIEEQMKVVDLLTTFGFDVTFDDIKGFFKEYKPARSATANAKTLKIRKSKKKQTPERSASAKKKQTATRSTTAKKKQTATRSTTAKKKQTATRSASAKKKQTATRSTTAKKKQTATRSASAKKKQTATRSTTAKKKQTATRSATAKKKQTATRSTTAKKKQTATRSATGSDLGMRCRGLVLGKPGNSKQCRALASMTVGWHDVDEHEAGTFESSHLCKRCARADLVKFKGDGYGVAIRPLYQRRLFIATREMIRDAKKIVRDEMDAKRMREEAEAYARMRFAQSTAEVESQGRSQKKFRLPRQNYGDDT
jgi:hypothetical protein